MAAGFDPDKYVNSGEWKIAVNPVSSHYEKLGLRFEDSLSNEQINEAFYKRYTWWNEKDKIARSGQAHPTIKIVGPFISDAIKNLREAKSILLDTTKKLQYDNKLREKINKRDEEDLIRYIRFALQGDNQISQEEKRNLLNMADTLKIDRDRAEEIIIAEIKKVGATFKSESDFVDSTSSSMPFDVLLNKTYYEILCISEDADYSKIKEVYDREYQKYNTVRDKKRAEARWVVVSEAWECLRDPDKRRKYNEKLRRERERGLTAEGDPKLEIVDESGKEKTRFEFKDMKLGTTSSVTVIAKNGGGGTLDAKIITNYPWLIVDTDRIHQSKLPQHITITVDPKKHQRENCLGGHDKGVIEITYPEASKPEKIYVDFSIEIENEALNRFRKFLTFGGLILGGLFGYFIYNLSLIHGMNANVAGIAGIVAIIGAVIVVGRLGYQDGGGGSAFGWGCGTLIVGFIVLAILESYSPHGLSIFSWTLAYGSFANMLSQLVRRALWRANRSIPIAAGVGVLTLTALIIIGGFMATKQEKESGLARAKTTQRTIQTIRSKLLGEWHGKIGRNEAKLFITRASKQLSGKMVFGGFEEKLSVNLKNNDGKVVIVLKGTSYKRLKSKGRFYLDTFYGKLSSDGRHIKGNYIDAAKRKGKWSVSKVGSVLGVGRIFVKTDPTGAKIRILNIQPKFYQGMKLKQGRYHVEVSFSGYKTQKKWIKLGSGEDRRINISLVKMKYEKIPEKEKRPAVHDLGHSLPPPPSY